MRVIVVAGPVSSGKTTALFPNEQLGIQGLPLDQMYYLSCAGSGKELPVKGWRKIFKPESKIAEGGRFMRTRDPEIIGQLIEQIITKHPDIKYLVIDDLNYVQSFTVLNKTTKFEYEDWRLLATRFFSQIINRVTEDTPRDLTVILQFHIERPTETSDFKIKTAGKMIDNYIELEGLVSWLFFTYTKEQIVDGKAVTQYFYLTNRLGPYPAKSLPGAFAETMIKSDMGQVIAAVDAYSNEN